MSPAFDARALRVLTAAPLDPAPLRPGPLLRGAGLAAGAGLAMAATLALCGGAAEAAGTPAGGGAWALAGTLALSVAGTCLSLPRRRFGGGSPALLLAVAVGLPLLAVSWLLLWHDTLDPHVRLGGRCFADALAMAPWPFLALVLAGRPFDPRHPALAGAALGATAGAWSAAALELACPLAIPDHVVVCHVLPVALLAAAGALYGARRFGLRRVA